MEPTDLAGRDAPTFETDPRFPSGPWTGFFLQPGTPERHWMELDLTFRDGVMAGAGRDRVGKFAVSGRYHLDDGKAHWDKTYLRAHSIAYAGYNEGKGIWGTWDYQSNWRGGFLIWPVAMGDPTKQTLTVAVDAPREAEAPAPAEPAPEPVEAAPAERELVPAGAALKPGSSEARKSLIP